MKNLQIYLLCFLFSLSSLAREKEILTLGQAMKEKKIGVSLVSKGGYKGRVLSGKFVNLTEDSLYVLIEAGRRFDSKDSSEQDLLMAEELLLAFSSRQKKKAELKVFCCQAHNRSPLKDSVYFPGRMADKKLVELAEFISKDEFSNRAIQAAVWTVSDKNHPASIFDPGHRASSEQLQQFTCNLVHFEPPWYHLTYNQAQDEAGYINQRALKISGEIYIENDSCGKMDAYITDSKGNGIINFLDNYPVKQGGKNFNFDFSVDGWPRKEYAIVFCRNGKVIMEKGFSL